MPDTERSQDEGPVMWHKRMCTLRKINCLHGGVTPWPRPRVVATAAHELKVSSNPIRGSIGAL